LTATSSILFLIFYRRVFSAHNINFLGKFGLVSSGALLLVLFAKWLTLTNGASLLIEAFNVTYNSKGAPFRKTNIPTP
jgi:hypothetical protein